MKNNEPGIMDNQHESDPACAQSRPLVLGNRELSLAEEPQMKASLATELREFFIRAGVENKNPLAQPGRHAGAKLKGILNPEVRGGERFFYKSFNEMEFIHSDYMNVKLAEWQSITACDPADCVRFPRFHRFTSTDEGFTKMNTSIVGLFDKKRGALGLDGLMFSGNMFAGIDDRLRSHLAKADIKLLAGDHHRSEYAHNAKKNKSLTQRLLMFLERKTNRVKFQGKHAGDSAYGAYIAVDRRTRQHFKSVFDLVKVKPSEITTLLLAVESQFDSLIDFLSHMHQRGDLLPRGASVSPVLCRDNMGQLTFQLRLLDIDHATMKTPLVGRDDMGRFKQDDFHYCRTEAEKAEYDRLYQGLLAGIEQVRNGFYRGIMTKSFLADNAATFADEASLYKPITGGDEFSILKQLAIKLCDQRINKKRALVCAKAPVKKSVFYLWKALLSTSAYVRRKRGPTRRSEIVSLLYLRQQLALATTAAQALRCLHDYNEKVTRRRYCSRRRLSRGGTVFQDVENQLLLLNARLSIASQPEGNGVAARRSVDAFCDTMLARSVSGSSLDSESESVSIDTVPAVESTRNSTPARWRYASYLTGALVLSGVIIATKGLALPWLIKCGAGTATGMAAGQSTRCFGRFFSRQFRSISKHIEPTPLSLN